MAVTPVNASDTLDQGRVKFNANDQALQTQADSLQSQQTSHLSTGHPAVHYTKTEVDTQQSNQDAALNAHKASHDHDALYLAASYLATLVRTSFNQVIDGFKTFLQNIIIKNVSPGIFFNDASGVPMGQIRFTKSGILNVLQLFLVESSYDTPVIVVQEGTGLANFPNHDVLSKGNRLATESFVATQVANSGGSSSGASTFVLYDSPQTAPSLSDPTSAAPDYPTYEGGGPTLVPKIKLKYLHRAGIRHIRVFGLAHAGGEEDPVDIRVQIGGIHADTPISVIDFANFTVALDVSTLVTGNLYDLSVGIIGQMSDTFGWMREILILADTL
jgi:hypothetical protein